MNDFEVKDLAEQLEGLHEVVEALLAKPSCCCKVEEDADDVTDLARLVVEDDVVVRQDMPRLGDDGPGADRDRLLLAVHTEHEHHRRRGLSVDLCRREVAGLRRRRGQQRSRDQPSTDHCRVRQPHHVSSLCVCGSGMLRQTTPESKPQGGQPADRGADATTASTTESRRPGGCPSTLYP